MTLILIGQRRNGDVEMSSDGISVGMCMQCRLNSAMEVRGASGSRRYRMSINQSVHLSGAKVKKSKVFSVAPSTCSTTEQPSFKSTCKLSSTYVDVEKVSW